MSDPIRVGDRSRFSLSFCKFSRSRSTFVCPFHFGWPIYRVRSPQLWPPTPYRLGRGQYNVTGWDRSHGLRALSRMWQLVKLSNVSLGIRLRYSLVADEDVKKPTNQQNKLSFSTSFITLFCLCLVIYWSLFCSFICFYKGGRGGGGNNFCDFAKATQKFSLLLSDLCSWRAEPVASSYSVRPKLCRALWYVFLSFFL